MRNLFAVIVLVFTFLPTTKAQYIEMPDGSRLDTTSVYNEAHNGIGDSLHIVGKNNFMTVDINLKIIEYSGMTNFIAKDRNGFMWLMIRSHNPSTGWYYWDLIDLENLDYRIRYYDRQRL